ncbi:MAG: flavin reductase family protein [Pseudomonadota bacterium]
MIVDLNSLSTGQVYMTMIQTLIPRPVAWVLSENSDSGFNLAPFSYFNAVCSDPPMIMFSVSMQQDGSAKDTRANIEARDEFVVHIAHRDMARYVTESSANLPPGKSEVEELELELNEFPASRLPKLADARIAYACKLDHIQEIGNNKTSLIFGRVNALYVADEVVAEDAKGRRVYAAEKIDPIGRLGGGEYTTFGEKIYIPRPK